MRAAFCRGTDKPSKSAQWQFSRLPHFMMLKRNGGVRSQLEKALVKFPWLKPVDIEIFGGKFDPALLRFPWNLLPALRMMPPSDIRDWTAIRTWASNLADKFQYGSPEWWDN
jgi:menaquinone-dependent protoporphyrinogen IX oxidase